MVSFRAMGRAGNFLFCAASSYGYARRHGLEWSVPNWTSHHFWSPLYLQHLVHPDYDRREDVLINENGMQYQEIPFEEEWRGQNIVLNGYWQSEMYFKEYRDEILELFNYKWEMQKGVISVHVRRTDYLALTQKHPPVTKEWYEEAMSMFKGYIFKFYSDDIKWCIDTFGSRGDCIFSDGKSIEQDLVGISCAEHCIISASTFGWWGAWLNRNEDKKIVLPAKWLCEGWDNADTSDIVPETWIKL